MLQEESDNSFLVESRFKDKSVSPPGTTHMRIAIGSVVGEHSQHAKRLQVVDRAAGRGTCVPGLGRCEVADLDVGQASSDNEIKRALARHLEVPEARLRDYVIDRHETGNMTIRPEAVFG